MAGMATMIGTAAVIDTATQTTSKLKFIRLRFNECEHSYRRSTAPTVFV